MKKTTFIVVAWHNDIQISVFLAAWGIDRNNIPPWLILSQDKGWKSCARTKNLGIDEAVKKGAEIIVVIDDDMFPYGNINSLVKVAQDHEEALRPQPIETFIKVSDPISRGTPYFEENRIIYKEVAASMGWWAKVPDWSAISQLVYGPDYEMDFSPQIVYGKVCALSGMNFAFKTSFLPWAYFIEVDRYDDIWMGYLLCKEAHRRDHCINLEGPTLTHSRQSNVWKNLAAEVKYQEANETLWRDIWESKETEYKKLRGLLPV